MLTDTIGFRAATPDDAALMRAIFDDAKRSEFPGIDGPVLDQLLDLQFRAASAERASRYPGAVTSLVLLDSEVVGSITADHTGRDAHLVDLAILSQHRGGGLGSRALSWLAASADRVTLTVWALNDGAIRLYRRHGFTTVSEQGGYLAMSTGAAR